MNWRVGESSPKNFANVSTIFTADLITWQRSRAAKRAKSVAFKDHVRSIDIIW